MNPGEDALYDVVIAQGPDALDFYATMSLVNEEEVEWSPLPGGLVASYFNVPYDEAKTLLGEFVEPLASIGYWAYTIRRDDGSDTVQRYQISHQLHPKTIDSYRKLSKCPEVFSLSVEFLET